MIYSNLTSWSAYYRQGFSGEDVADHNSPSLYYTLWNTAFQNSMGSYMVLLLPNVIRYSMFIHSSFDRFSYSFILLSLFSQSTLFATLDGLLVESTTYFYGIMDNLFLGFSDVIVNSSVSCLVGYIFLPFISILWFIIFCKSKYLDLSCCLQIFLFL